MDKLRLIVIALITTITLFSTISSALAFHWWFFPTKTVIVRQEPVIVVRQQPTVVIVDDNVRVVRAEPAVVKTFRRPTVVLVDSGTRVSKIKGGTIKVKALSQAESAEAIIFEGF